MPVSHEPSPTSDPPWPQQVIGSKYVRLLSRQLMLLRNESSPGDQPPVHGNQKLFLDDVFVTYLLAFFNPAVRSLRMIEDFSQAPAVQAHLSLPRICKSTLADFQKLADPTRLEPMIQALRKELNRKFGPQEISASSPEGQLQSLLSQTIAVDGTFLPALAQTTWSICQANNHGTQKHRARLDLHLAVETWLPEAIVIPEAKQSEADSAKLQLQPGKLYLYDRGFMSFDLLAAHYEQSPEAVPLLRSNFVARYRPAGCNAPELQQMSERALTSADLASGVMSDRVGLFQPGDKQRQSLFSHIPLREVLIVNHEQGEVKTLRLITNMLDIPAEHIGLLYHKRWQVELFFRWFKTLANFGHLISCTPNGVLLHMSVAVIAIMLMYLHTGYRPSKYLFSLLGLVAQGSATMDQIMPILRERERQCARDRLSAAKRRKKRA